MTADVIFDICSMLVIYVQCMHCTKLAGNRSDILKTAIQTTQDLIELFFTMCIVHIRIHIQCLARIQIFLATVFIPLQMGILNEEEYHNEYGCVVFAFLHFRFMCTVR